MENVRNIILLHFHFPRKRLFDFHHYSFILRRYNTDEFYELSLSLSPLLQLSNQSC